MMLILLAVYFLVIANSFHLGLAKQDVLPSKLVVVGGGGALGQVEIVDLSGQVCPDLPDYPLEASITVGAFLNGHIVICGGFANSDHHDECYFYEPNGRQWLPSEPMLEKRGFAAAALLDDENMWITGGLNFEEAEEAVKAFRLSTTEIKSFGETGRKFVDLPVGKQEHNLVRVNDTHFVVVGGNPTSTDVWIFDVTTEEWTRLPDIPEVANVDIEAGLVRYPNGTQLLVVAGGFFANYHMGLDLNTLQWVDLPTMPHRIDYAASVPYGDTFLIVGGNDETSHLVDTIYKFDTAANDWLLLPQRLKTARYKLTAFFIPDDHIQC